MKFSKNRHVMFFTVLCLAAALFSLLSVLLAGSAGISLIALLKHGSLRRPEKWISEIRRMGLCSAAFFLAAGAFIFFLSERLPALVKNPRIHAAVRSEVGKLGLREFFISYKKPFIWIFVILVVAFSSLIIANSPYKDDYERIKKGFVEMGRPWSRYSSVWFAKLVATNLWWLSDMSPFTQLLACAFIALSGYIVIHAFNGNKKVSLAQIVAVLPIGVFPYFLECMSYKFDCAYNMSFSVIASVIPMIFVKSDIIYAVMAFAGSFIMCTSYQACCGYFPVIVVLMTLYRLNTEGSSKKLWRTFGISVASYFAALLLFKIFVCKSVDAYASTNLLPMKEIGPGFFRTLVEYWRVFLDDMRPFWILLFAAAFSGSFGLSLWTASVNLKKKNILFNVLGFAFLLMIFLGAFPALDSNEKFTPRYMIGFGFLMACTFAYFCTVCPRRKISLLVVLPVSWSMCAFALAYGNAVHQNDLYNHYRMSTILNDLNNFDFMHDGKKKKIGMEGLTASPYIVTFMPKYQRVLFKKLISGSLDYEWVQGLYINYYFNLPDTEYAKVHIEDLDSHLVKSTVYQDYYYDDDQLLIRLKDDPSDKVYDFSY